MEPDRRLDAIERAHLKAPDDRSHVLHRYAPDRDLADLAQRFWIPAHTDRFVDLRDVLGAAGVRLVEAVRTAMRPDPHSPQAHAAATAAYADVLRPYLPVDPEGLLVNRLVAHVEEHPEVQRVAQVCEAFGLSERALQRLVSRRLGLTPWLISRRRLQEAAERLRTDPRPMADLAAELGYADQAHFTRDFSRVTGTTPGRFAAAHR